MKELLDKFLMYFCFAGIGSIAVFAFVRVTLNKWKMKNVKCKIRKFILHSPFYILHFLIPILCVAGMILYGSTKNNSPTNDPPAQTQMVSQPSLCGEMQVEKIVVDVPGARPLQSAGVATTQSLELNDTQPTNSLVRVEKWWRRGAYNDGQVLTFDEDWCFPYGTNHLTSVEVWASGAVYASMKAPSPIAELVTKLSVAPQDTEVFMGRTTNNTYRIEWHGGHPNRDLNQTADASIELFRNGNIIVTEGGVETEVPYVVPFEHIGFGQNDDWVRANFTRLQALSPSLTNAEEIISIGYANWVDQQVGVGLTNGLYKFSAEFLEDPPEPTELYIGDYSVCVTNAGVYSFVLEKGEEYEFGTWPFNDDIDYWAQDDLAADAPMLTAWWGGWEKPGEWTIDGGWNWFWRPSFSYGRYYNGCCAWLPTLQGSPEVAQLRESDFPKLFLAVVSDYPSPDDLRYEWKSSDRNIRIMSPHSRETLIAVDSMPSWDYFDLSVSTEIKGRSYTSSVTMCYGTNETPVASLALSAPKVVFVNDDDRTSRWYRVSAKLSSPTPTNAVLSVSHTGGVQILYATDPEGKNRFAMTNVNLVVDSPVPSTRYDFYFAATNNNCTGKFTATCTLADSTALSANGEYKVIEPLRKLVCNDQVAGGYYNPSRLVYGTNAWLKVGVNGQFNASDVQWRVVSGPGRIASRNDSDWAVSVEPTAPSGEVVVEAAFGNDSVIQPRFVLPIVTQRTLPVRAFVVGTNNVSVSAIETKIAYANRIFSQAGILLDLVSVSNNVAQASDAIVSEFQTITNASGRVRKVLSPQASRVMNTYTAGDCLELYFVTKIIDGKAVAFRTSQGIIVSQRASDHVVAHEIGHCFGLKDCYASRNTGGAFVRIERHDLPIDEGFMSTPRDWGLELKRGFYSKSDTREKTLHGFLMYGVDGKDGVDIPAGDVLSLTKEATLSTQTQRSIIGSDHFKQNNSEVFTR